MRDLKAENKSFIQKKLERLRYPCLHYWTPKEGEPRTGEERIITRFLWWPLTLNHERRWLCRVTIRQIYLPVYRKFGFGHIYRFCWINGQFEA